MPYLQVFSYYIYEKEFLLVNYFIILVTCSQHQCSQCLIE